jgi:hypothetical protein
MFDILLLPGMLRASPEKKSSFFIEITHESKITICYPACCALRLKKVVFFIESTHESKLTFCYPACCALRLKKIVFLIESTHESKLTFCCRHAARFA